MMHSVQSMLASLDSKFTEVEQISDQIDWLNLEEHKENVKVWEESNGEVNQLAEQLNGTSVEYKELKQDVDGVRRKIEQSRAEITSELKNVKTDLKRAVKANDFQRRDLSKRKHINAAFDAFLDQFGIYLHKFESPGPDEDTSLKSLVFSKIFPDKESLCTIYFSKLSRKFDEFHVESAEPFFPEFYNLAEKANNSQNLMNLILETRRHWLLMKDVNVDS